MKKSLILLALLFFGFLAGASYASDIKVSINGQTQNFDVPPASVEGRTMVPLRHIFEALGADLDWEASTQTITGLKDGKQIVLVVGQKFAMIDGVRKELDVPAMLINGRTMVPTRFIAESLGADVQWDGARNTVVINKDKLNEDVKPEIILAETSIVGSERKEGNLYIKETDNFKFIYTEIDRNNIDDFIMELELNHERIADKYKVKMPKINARLYPSWREYHNITNFANPPAWSVGQAIGTNQINMVSPNYPGLVHSYQSMLKIIVHEYTHLVTNSINSNIGRATWLAEATSVFEANQFRNPKHLDYIMNGEFPTLEQINSFNNTMEYDLGFVMIEFIEYKWSVDRLIELIKNGGNILKTFGISTESFEKEWHQFIKDKYLN